MQSVNSFDYLVPDLTLLYPAYNLNPYLYMDEYMALHAVRLRHS